MKSGPKQLQQYHELVLRAEENNLTVEEEEALERGKERLAKMNAQTTTAVAETAPVVAAVPANEEKKRKPRGPNRPKPELPAGVTVIKLEVSKTDLEELLGYALRTRRTGLAHQLVDAIAKMDVA